MVLLAGTTGLRRSELIALTWRDVCFVNLHIEVNKSCVRAQIGETKTVASAKPVSLHPVVGRRFKNGNGQPHTLTVATSSFLQYGITARSRFGRM